MRYHRHCSQADLGIYLYMRIFTNPTNIQLYCKGLHMTRPVWAPGSLSVWRRETWGRIEDACEMVTPKVPCTLRPQYMPIGCLYYVPGSVPLSETDGVLTWMVFILSGWLLKFKPLLLLILVLLCRIIDIFLMVEYMVNLRWTFRKRDCSHDSNLLSVIST